MRSSQKKIWHEVFLGFEKKKWICTQRSKYAQNNPLAVFKIVLRSPLELSGTCGSKILIENIYFNNSKLFFHSTSSLPNNQNSFEGCFSVTKLWCHCHFDLHEDNGNVIIIIQRNLIIKIDFFNNSKLTLLPFQTTRILLLRAASLSQNYDGIAILIYIKIMAMSSL